MTFQWLASDIFNETIAIGIPGFFDPPLLINHNLPGVTLVLV